VPLDTEDGCAAKKAHYFKSSPQDNLQTLRLVEEIYRVGWRRKRHIE